jgi:hypothetical protein
MNMPITGEVEPTNELAFFGDVIWATQGRFLCWSNYMVVSDGGLTNSY